MTVVTVTTLQAIFPLCERWTMSNEQGKKRLLSPGNINLTDDKRRRNDSLEIDESDPTQKLDMEPEHELSLLDLKKSMDAILFKLTLTATKDNLKELASKEDFKELDNPLLAQNHEIGQLRDELKTLKGNLDTLQANVDSQLAASMSSGMGSVGRDPGTTTQNIA